MRRGLEMVVVAALALGSAALVLGCTMQQAKAEPLPGAESQQAGSGLESKRRTRAARVKRPSKAKTAIARVAAVPPAADGPAFLSDEWLKNEQRTDDRLKKFMTICRGC